MIGAAAVMLPAGRAVAAAGNLDPTFGGDGKVTRGLGTTLQHQGFAIDVAQQRDGKLVAAGYRPGRGGDYDFLVVRYNANGHLDTSFGAGGTVTTDFGGGDDFAHAVSIQSDGKIVVAGRADEGGANDMALARYRANGHLDTSFGAGGRVTTNFGGADSAQDIAIQPDGKIVAAGTADENGAANFSLARYKTNGTLDRSFSGDGKQTTDFGAVDQALGVAIQTGDEAAKIVVVGFTGHNPPNGGERGHSALARYKANGHLDHGFSGDGKQITRFGGSDEQAWKVAIQANAKIVAVGQTNAGPGASNFALARYKPDGHPDPGFSGDGRQITKFRHGGVANDVAIQPDGKIVVAGNTDPGRSGEGYFALARYKAHGNLDPGFSGDGKQTTGFGPFPAAALRGTGIRSQAATGVAIQSDGKIVAAGGYENPLGEDPALARYRPNGHLDHGFSGDGRAIVPGFQVTSDDGCAATAIQSDGKILCAGSSDRGRSQFFSGFALSRFNPDGSPDSSFGANGTVLTGFRGPGAAASASAVAIQSDGKIVVAGRVGLQSLGSFSGVCSNCDVDFALSRYNPNGTLDSSFSGDGKQTTRFGGDGGGASDVAIQADGSIVAVGGDSHFSFARYKPDGTLDTSFSGDGKQLLDVKQPGDYNAPRGVAIQSDGKIVAVGYTTHSGVCCDSSFGLIRLNADGTLDTGFSGDGRQTTTFDQTVAGAFDVALQPDGKIVAVGDADKNPGLYDDNFALARYNPDGTLDSSFSGDGRQTTNLGLADTAFGVAIQPDDKIVLAGFTSGFRHRHFAQDFALARYNPDGTLDSSFSADGKQTTDFGFYDGASGVAIQSDGGIVLAGDASTADFGSHLALARYIP